ncbi:ferrochelatase [Liquorilactobacillus capillatus]|uniref:Coproporphyrin III ferrochelatase n=1 Tax=Liquorilactobacillus capillatus DSM 19910 TaxID=1423731 RepID=A0A0R1M0L7_9LACO|nr:ferrochelatase [Liquorilactobacillus capillatus]KRL01533.1 ferrochelatase [Liquorilactobacillus capillatus DSM 19910]
MHKAVLLVNTGTPATSTREDVRSYLKCFLSDPHIINMPYWQWQPILRLMILPWRPFKSAKLYQQIWLAEKGSPLEYYTKQQARKLQTQLPEYIVKYAMSYSKPTIAEVLKTFEQIGIDSLTVIPLYPQYSRTTTGAVIDEIHRFYTQKAAKPVLHIVKDFCSTEEYIKALTTQIKEGVATFKPDKVLYSYHGIPVSYVVKGDIYQMRCNLTTKLLAKSLPQISAIQTYQSRFGFAPWLEPATKATLKQLPAKGIKHVLVVAPSFVADCLETLNELAIENRAAFLKSGGTDYHVLPALNDSQMFIDVLEQLVRRVEE